MTSIQIKPNKERDHVEATPLDVVGTIGASGGGLVGIFLLVRGLWKMWSGQLQEQRLLLADARQSRADIVAERDLLRDEVVALKALALEHEAKHVDRVNELKRSSNSEAVRRRQLAEYASRLRRISIEHGVAYEDLPDFPTNRAATLDD